MRANVTSWTLNECVGITRKACYRKAPRSSPLIGCVPLSERNWSKQILKYHGKSWKSNFIATLGHQNVTKMLPSLRIKCNFVIIKRNWKIRNLDRVKLTKNHMIIKKKFAQSEIIWTHFVEQRGWTKSIYLLFRRLLWIISCT